jgi:hypothetical protein
MAELLCTYTTALASHDGRLFRARAWGAQAADGTRRWNGWLEFVPLDGGHTVTTGAETTQPSRASTIYWATGLRAVYLEGALGRALKAPPGRAVSLATAAAQIEKPTTGAGSGTPGIRRRSGSRSPTAAVNARGWSGPLSAWDRWLLKSFGICTE